MNTCEELLAITLPLLLVCVVHVCNDSCNIIHCPLVHKEVSMRKFLQADEVGNFDWLASVVRKAV